MREWHSVYFFPLLFGLAIAFLCTHLNVLLDEASIQQRYDVEIENSYEDDKTIDNYDFERGMLLDVDKSTLSAMVAKGLVHIGSQVYDKQTKERVRVSDVVAGVPSSIINGWIIFCGAIGISAMLLPGISGSYLLTILGVYPLIIEALADLTAGLSNFTIDRDAVLVLGNLLVGIIIGATLFSRVISWLFHHYHDVTIAMLIGFMLGALPVVWPFWEYRYFLSPLKPGKGARIEAVSMFLPDFNSWMMLSACAVAIAAFLAVIAIELAAARQPENT
jgi:putative membrane protein